MGNSSWSVKEALGAFNFRKISHNVSGLPMQFRADLGGQRFAILQHANGPKPPEKFKDPISVSVYEVVGKLHYRVWTNQYNSVTDFLTTIHTCVPWNIPKCDKMGCKNRPVPDATLCERHLEAD